MLPDIQLSESKIKLIGELATVASYGANGSMVFLGLTAEEWTIAGVLFGIAFGAITLGFNVWFKMKYMRNEKRKSK